MPRALSQRANQKAVTASLEGDCKALDPASLPSPLPLAIDAAASAMRSRRPRAFFKRLALDARYDTGNEASSTGSSQ